MREGSRRSVAFLGLALVALVGLLLGAVAADPLGAVRRVNEARLRAFGASEHFFRGGDGTRLRVWELGPASARVPVVLLHGLGASGDYWTGTARALGRAGRTVLLPDAPGSGRSEPPAAPEGYGIAGRVAAVDALVSAMALERFDLVGHSLGGWTAARYALGKPWKIRRLVLVDAGGFTPIPAEEVEDARRHFAPQDRASGRRLLDLLFFKRPMPAPGFVVDGLARNYRAPNVAETVRQLGLEDALAGREAELPAGTVLIWGEKETLFPLEGARRTQARIPQARLLVVPGVGHDGPLEAPAAFYAALLSALGSEETPAR